MKNMLSKKEFIELLDKYDDDQLLDLWLFEDEGNPKITTYDSKDALAYEVYKHIIEAIADGEKFDWQDICENIFLEDMDYIDFLGIVKKVHPEVHNDKVCYRIDKDELTDKMHGGIFEPAGGYWVYQRTVYEDSYNGQMLIPLGYKGWMVVYYSC